MAKTLRILAVEPYFGGPHADFLEGLRAHSRHEWTLLTMPAKHWKWRMHGGAMHLAQQLNCGLKGKTATANSEILRSAQNDKAKGGTGPFDLILASDFLNVAEFKALAPEAIARAPVVTYFHENQLSYPLEPGQRRDPQYAMINLSTCLASQEVWFNSAFHRDAWHAALRALLSKMPDYVPEGLVDGLLAKSRVMPPGMNLEPFAAGRRRERPPERPLTILWNHRWEFDKNPELFFEVLMFLAQEDVPLRVAVVGEASKKWPPIFQEARKVLADRLIRFGYIPRRDAYEALVCQADIVVSTAHHEFFGLPVVEAVAAGCFPLVPARLSYPEIVPPDMQDTFFYTTERELRVKLTRLLAGKGPWDKAFKLSQHVQRYDWTRCAKAYDDGFERAAKNNI
jgi:glycosyltransferase involved in cell wall biosynthesis